MELGIDAALPVSLKADKQIYARPESGTAVSVRRFPDRKSLDETLRQREELLAELGDCPWLNLPRRQRVHTLADGCALVEEMLLARSDGPRQTWERDLLNGVAAMHRSGWAHMDIKPEHLLWADGHWRLHDLDGAMRIGTRFQRRDVTYAYAPPDALWHDRADARDDLYAVALMLYARQNHSRLPFERNSERRATALRWIVPWIPVPGEWGREARFFYRRALARFRRNRFQTAEELMDAWNRLKTK